MNRIKIYAIFALLPLFLSVAYMLFCIKENVMRMDIELNLVRKEIAIERNNIKVLEAELAYLSSPKRLQKLNLHFVKLGVPKIIQMSVDPGSGTDDKLEVQRLRVANGIMRKSSTRWRYKKGPSQYLTLVSKKK